MSEHDNQLLQKIAPPTTRQRLPDTAKINKQ